MTTKIIQKKLPPIAIPNAKGLRVNIMKAAGCSRRTLWLAERGYIDGPKSKLARDVAEMKVREFFNQYKQQKTI